MRLRTAFGISCAIQTAWGQAGLDMLRVALCDAPSCEHAQQLASMGLSPLEGKHDWQNWGNEIKNILTHDRGQYCAAPNSCGRSASYCSVTYAIDISYRRLWSGSSTKSWVMLFHVGSA